MMKRTRPFSRSATCEGGRELSPRKSRYAAGSVKMTNATAARAAAPSRTASAFLMRSPQKRGQLSPPASRPTRPGSGLTPVLVVAGVAVLQDLGHLGLEGGLVLDGRHRGLRVLAELQGMGREVLLVLPYGRESPGVVPGLGILRE